MSSSDPKRGHRRPAGGIAALLIAVLVLPLAAACSRLSLGTTLAVLGIGIERSWGTTRDSQQADGDVLSLLANPPMFPGPTAAVLHLAVKATNPNDAGVQDHYAEDVYDARCEASLPGLAAQTVYRGTPSPYGFLWTDIVLIGVPTTGRHEGTIRCPLQSADPSVAPEWVSATFSLDILPFWLSDGQTDYNAQVGSSTSGVITLSSLGLPVQNPPVQWSIDGPTQTYLSGALTVTPNCATGKSLAAFEAMMGSKAQRQCSVHVRFEPQLVQSVTTNVLIPYEWYQCRKVDAQGRCGDTELIRAAGNLTIPLTTNSAPRETPVTPPPAPPIPPPPAAPGFQANPLAFGDQQVNSPTPPAALMLVHNNGKADLTVSATAVDPIGEYVIDNGCLGAPVPPSNICQIRVTFNPTSVGSKNADLVFTTNAGEKRVALSGTGTQAGWSSDKDSLDFTTSVGDTSAAQTVTITNTGSAPLVYGPTGIKVTGTGTDAERFELTNACTTIQPNQTCQLEVKFKPTAVGTVVASLDFTDNAPPGQHSVALTGTAVPPS